MKRKAISILAAGLVMASFAGCGTQAETANSAVPGQSLNETVVVYNNASADVEENTGNESTNEEPNNINMEAGTSDTGFVIYDTQNEITEEVDVDSIVTLDEPIPRTLNVDTDVYDVDGRLVGYIKSGTPIDFRLVGIEWVAVDPDVEGLSRLYIRVEDLDKNVITDSENESENNQGLLEDVTDGNITLYGGEKYPQKYAPLDEGISEELNIVFTNEDVEIPLFSGDGRLCGHINNGGTILINGHCEPASAWYRIDNPIAGTEYDYLYVLIYETKTAKDNEDYFISFIERQTNNRFKPTILDTPEADMECYEFSMPREDGIGILGMISPYLFNDEFYLVNYNTFCLEFVRNGDYYDCKIYYK